jgi:nucleoside-diphosphate-sugar epimerase
VKVFVAGATGVVGRRAVASLVSGGHSVTGVARSREKRALVEKLGAAPTEVDLFDASAVRTAVDGHDVVINLATKIPPLAKAMLPGAWDENNRIRSEVSINLADACLATSATRFIQESLAFMYPDRGDEWIDEDVPVDPPKFASSTLTAEAAAQKVTDGGGLGVVLRFGQFYAPDAAHTITWVSMAKKGISPFAGPPEAYFPLVHADDAGSAVAAALTAPAGIYNVTDDEPLRYSEMAEALAAPLDVSKLRFPPAPVVKLGGAKASMLMRSQRVSNRRFRGAAAWEPRFGNARDGFDAVVKEIQLDQART